VEEEPAVPGWVTKTGAKLPGLGDPVAPFTVVRRDLELEFVTATVEAHRDGLDEWCGDFLDALLEQRHQARLRAIEDQAVLRTQQATDAEATTLQALREAALHAAEARREVDALEREAGAWAEVLSGTSDEFEVPTDITGAPPEAATVTIPIEEDAGLPSGWVWDGDVPGDLAQVPRSDVSGLGPSGGTRPASATNLRSIGTAGAHRPEQAAQPVALAEPGPDGPGRDDQTRSA